MASPTTKKTISKMLRLRSSHFTKANPITHSRFQMEYVATRDPPVGVPDLVGPFVVDFPFPQVPLPRKLISALLIPHAAFKDQAEEAIQDFAFECEQIPDIDLVTVDVSCVKDMNLLMDQKSELRTNAIVVNACYALLSNFLGQKLTCLVDEHDLKSEQ